MLPLQLGRTPLHIAVKSDRPDFVKLLMEAPLKPDIDTQDAVSPITTCAPLRIRKPFVLLLPLHQGPSLESLLHLTRPPPVLPLPSMDSRLCTSRAASA